MAAQKQGLTMPLVYCLIRNYTIILMSGHIRIIFFCVWDLLDPAKKWPKWPGHPTHLHGTLSGIMSNCFLISPRAYLLFMTVISTMTLLVNWSHQLECHPNLVNSSHILVKFWMSFYYSYSLFIVLITRKQINLEQISMMFMSTICHVALHAIAL